MKRSCPICSAYEYTLLFHDYNRREWYTELEWDFVECNSCGMRYATNIPSFEDMWSKYADIYVIPDIEALRKKLKDPIIKNEKKILDIGCNHGIQLISYYNSGWDIYGIDLNEKALIDVKKYLPKENFFLATIEKSPLENETFDKIQTFHVLEHVYSPHGFLSKCYNLLKKEGEIEIRVPNGWSLEMKIWWKYASQSWMPFHINLFRWEDLRGILEELGYKNIRTHTNPIPWWWILSFRQWRWTINITRGVTNFSQNNFHRILQVLLFPILFIISLFSYGEELHVIAKK